jgi:hypothetical protein
MQLEGVWVPERIEATIQEVKEQESLPLEKKLYTTFACTAGHLVNMCDASMRRARSSKPNNKIIVFGQTDWQPDSIDPNARHPV